MNDVITLENPVFGLDIGTRSVVGTVGYRKPNGQFVILAQMSKCHETRAMLDGQIHDIAKVAETVIYIKTQLEKELDIKLKNVCIAAAGRVLKTITVRMDYDLGDEMEITDEMIFSMELRGMEMANSELRKTITDGTSYYCVGYSIVKYYLGNSCLTNLAGHRGSHIGADVLATFLPTDVIDGLNIVCEKAGLRVANLTLEPIAAMNIAIPEKFRLLNLALVDIGAGTSDICITKDGSITGYGMLPCAGDFLTESIMKAVLTDFNTAEDMKLSYSKKKKKLMFKDVMGIKQTITNTDVEEILKEPFEKLTTLITDKILELNGGQRVGAIFIVGGGGKLKGFAEMLAEKANLPKQRVALRGEEVFTQVVAPDGKPVSDPMLVTPIGICLNYYDQKNNFIVINVNGNDVKLYDNGKLNVMDAALAVGMTNEDIFPKRGDNLTFTVNGSETIVKGGKGESAVITVNGENVGITKAVRNGDIIDIIGSSKGINGEMRLSEISAYKEMLTFIVNGKKTELPKMAYIGQKLLSENYEIKEGDSIIIPDYYKLSELLKVLKVEKGFTLTINNREIDLESYDPEEKVMEQYIIDIRLKEDEKMTNLVKDARDVVAEALDDGSDGETIIDDDEGYHGEGYEDYLDRRYGKNQFRSVSHDEYEEEPEEEHREGYGRFGRLSGMEINALIRGEELSSGMETALDNFSRAMSKEARKNANAVKTGSTAGSGLKSDGGFSTKPSNVNEEEIKRLEGELALLQAKMAKKKGVNGMSSLQSPLGLSSLTGLNSSLSVMNGAGRGSIGAGFGSVSSDSKTSETGQSAVAEQPAAENVTIHVNVNNTPVTLKNKPSYTFVDVLDVYKFDTSTAQGDTIVTKINGAAADFFTPIKEGDQIALFWGNK